MEQINKNTLVSVHDEELTLLEAFDKFIEVLNLSDEVNSVKDKESALEQFVTDAYGRLNNKILTNANEIDRVDEKTKDLDNDIMNVKQLIKPVYAYACSFTLNDYITINAETKTKTLQAYFTSSQDCEIGDVTFTEATELIFYPRLALAYLGLVRVTLLTINDATSKIQIAYFDTAENKTKTITITDVTRIRVTGKHTL